MAEVNAADKSLPPTPAHGANPDIAHGNGRTHGGVNGTSKPNDEVTTSSIQAQSDRPSPPPTPKKSGNAEKQEMMEKMQPPKGSKPIDLAQQKGDRWAKDPVTGQDVLIRDPSFKGTLSVFS